MSADNVEDVVSWLCVKVSESEDAFLTPPSLTHPHAIPHPSRSSRHCSDPRVVTLSLSGGEHVTLCMGDHLPLLLQGSVGMDVTIAQLANRLTSIKCHEICLEKNVLMRSSLSSLLLSYKLYLFWRAERSKSNRTAYMWCAIISDLDFTAKIH